MIPGYGREQVYGARTDREEGCGFTSWPRFYRSKFFSVINSCEMNNKKT